ncbi:uncharacterized protein LOC128032663 [Gossypium raimondii]|uniref:uncharacterized protein LOC128032663 n=1 Tax=Gossypium raimondii TaxID=29730 RepID=UPI00227B9B33|nr:uncharacterized protein LOC128032663 [Gossypium raimondii]
MTTPDSGADSGPDEVNGDGKLPFWCKAQLAVADLGRRVRWRHMGSKMRRTRVSRFLIFAEIVLILGHLGLVIFRVWNLGCNFGPGHKLGLTKYKCFIWKNKVIHFKFDYCFSLLRVGLDGRCVCLRLV